MPTLWHPAAYHVLGYGVLLGSSVFNSFFVGLVSYRALPRAQFAQLQTALFPKYFGLQTLLPLGLAATYPGASATASLAACVAALLDAPARSDLACIVVSAAMGALNWLALGPMTTRCMRERKHQETRDDRKSYDPPPHSEAMQRLNYRFTVLHSISSLANVVAMVAVVVYGVGLGARLA